VQWERDKKRAGEVMLQGIEELEDNLSLNETKTEDPWAGNLAGNDASRLQLLRQELFEIRGLLD
jgi:hypothetical protein